MVLFNENNGKLTPIKKIKFKLEKEMQNLTENNLNEIFNLEFVISEFQLNKLRIDTLAFDRETNSFVIIEYKNSKNFSVIDQGYAYLALLLNNKADFILEYNERMNKSLKKDDVDWSQSKVIFISPVFTRYQQQAIQFKDLPMELWEISKFSNGNILFNQVKSSDNNESITNISNSNEEIKKINKEIKVFTEEDHIKGKNEDVINCYFDIKSKIIDLDEDITINSTKSYISFSLNSIFTSFTIFNKNLLITLYMNSNELNDPKNSSKLLKNNNNLYSVIFYPEDDIDYLMKLIKQAYDVN